MNEPITRRANEADLRVYEDTNRQLGQMRVPVLVSRDRPNERLFLAVLDGTGNDMNNPEMGERTGVSRIFEQVRDQQNRGELTNVATAYLRGPGTQGGMTGTGDGVRGHTFEERAETMYQQFIEQAARWKRENPDADIRVAAIGFSRGAEQTAYFSRLVDERGIQDPTGAIYTRNDEGLVTGVRYTRPPLVPPGQVPQAVVLQDPVATGDPLNYDRRLPPSVVSALQIRARDEPRDDFIDSRHLPHGASDGGRSLHITVPGVHSNIGDGYVANGLGVRNTNMTMQYLNGLVDNGQPLLRLRPETPIQDRSNVIHNPDTWYFTTFRFNDGVRNESTQLAAKRYETLMDGTTYQVPPTAAEQRREAMDQGLAGRLGYKTLPLAPIPALPDNRRTEAGAPTGLQAPQTMLASDPGHRGHERYQQAYRGIVASPNIPAGTFSEALLPVVAANTAVTSLKGEGRNEPLPAITSVVFNGDRSALIASSGANGDPQLHAALPVDQATRGSLAEASKDLDGLLERQEKARATGSMTAAIEVAEYKAPSRA